MLSADPAARAEESALCIERDPLARDRATRASAWAEAVVAVREQLVLDAAVAAAGRRGECPDEARMRCTRHLQATRAERLRYAFCDAVLAGV